MKKAVYVVIYDNGEVWEDHQWYIDKIFTNEENAEKYVKDQEKDLPISSIFNCPHYSIEMYNIED